MPSLLAIKSIGHAENIKFHSVGVLPGFNLIAMVFMSKTVTILSVAFTVKKDQRAPVPEALELMEISTS